MSDPALGHVAEQTTVFARVSPMQKLRILRALRQRGHVVGYIGDGINDAPSLHAADVGISVATAVDVARDAADIILLRPGLDILHRGIIEGRKASGNVLKYLLMGHQFELWKHVQHGRSLSLSPVPAHAFHADTPEQFFVRQRADRDSYR